MADPKAEILSALCGLKEADADYTGYINQPIPCALDEPVAWLVDTFLALDEETRGAIIDCVSQRVSQTVACHGIRRATNSVREQTSAGLEDAAVAVVFDAGKFDWRENVIDMSLVHHCGSRAGADADDVFERAAQRLSGEARDLLAGFVRRTEENKRIEVMGYEEHEGPDGFCLRRIARM